MKKIYVVLIFFFLICVMGCTTSLPPNNSEPTQFKPYDYITIELRGEVNFPGLYQVESGSMLYEVVEIAGGFTNNANTMDLILVEPLLKNQKIIIPKFIDDRDEEEASDKLNINQVQKEELLQIPGIGDIKAEAIINYRNEFGSFQSLEDLMKVSGIGPTLYNTIKEYLTI